ncbi:MAG: propane monooxygenase reductase subunit [Gammaproteobacteria bacterium]|jgi:propane monooxygenase reductase subunit
MTHTVRLEPIGVDMEVEEEETVLQAAFRQGITLMHGCKEGQCSACKSVLLEGDAEHEDFSTFALSEPEQAEGKVLLCRLFAYSDLEIELLNYDEELLSNWIPAKKFTGSICAIEPLTHDIRRFDVQLDSPMEFRAGQYADITLPGTGVTRSYSMANSPSEQNTMSFIIKIYPDGAFSELLANSAKIGDAIEIEGPFGTSFRNAKHEGPTLLVGGGSGMAPLWSILNDIAENDAAKPVRFFYGARTEQDLFYLDEIAAIGEKLGDFEFIPALSDQQGNDGWSGATGFVHDNVASTYAGTGRNITLDAYACGPPPMVDAVLGVFQQIGVDADNIHLDKFTPATSK